VASTSAADIDSTSTWLRKASNEYGDDFGKRFPEGKGDVQTNAFFVDGKLILPLHRFQPYVGGGIGFLNANANGNVRRLSGGTSGTGFAGRVDGGIDLP